MMLLPCNPPSYLDHYNLQPSACTTISSAAASPELHHAGEDDGSVASKLLGAAPSYNNINSNVNNNNNHPSLSSSISASSSSVIDYSCKEPSRESPYQRRLQLKRMKLHHCAEELGSESCSTDYYCASDYSLQSQPNNPDDFPKLDLYPFSTDSSTSNYGSRSLSRHPITRSFPPPLAIHDSSSESYNNNNNMSLIPCREDGRFVLRQVISAPNCRSYFRAHRENGCLTLRLLAPESHSADGIAHDFTLNPTITAAAAAAAPPADKSSNHCTHDDHDDGLPDSENVNQSTEPRARQRNPTVHDFNVDDNTHGDVHPRSVDRLSFPDVLLHRIPCSHPDSGVIRCANRRRRNVRRNANRCRRNVIHVTATDEDRHPVRLANLNPLLQATANYCEPHHYRLVITANHAIRALITLRNFTMRRPGCAAHSHRVELGRATSRCGDSLARAPDAKRCRRKRRDSADPQLISGGEDGGDAGDNRPSATAWLLYDQDAADRIGEANQNRSRGDDGDKKRNGDDGQLLDDAELLTLNIQQELIKMNNTCEQQEALMAAPLTALRGFVVAGPISGLGGANHSLMCGLRSSTRGSFNMIKIHCVATRSC